MVLEVLIRKTSHEKFLRGVEFRWIFSLLRKKEKTQCQFILLLRESPDYAEGESEQKQAIFGRYRDWGRMLKEQGRMAGGFKLEGWGGPGATEKRVEAG